MASDERPGIHALASDAVTLYVGGFFAALGGWQRTRLAALDGRTGELLPWNPRIEGAGDASSPTDDASDEAIPYPRAYVGALGDCGWSPVRGPNWNNQNARLAQLAQKHQDGEGELQPSPVPEDIAREAEVPS